MFGNILIVCLQLLLFPEGTRFTEEKRKKSNEYAEKKGLQPLKHHLLPRTKGFVTSMHAVKGKSECCCVSCTMQNLASLLMPFI